MNETYFQGPRLYLRAVEPEDLDFMYEVENDPDNWSVSDFSAPYSRYALRHYLENTQCDIYTDHQLRLMAVERASGRQVGIVDISDYSLRHARGEVGILIQSGYRGQGYAREALRMLCDYVFNYLSFHQLTARMTADNEASIRLFRSCGFAECGLLKGWWHVGDEFKDVVLMQLLR